MSEENQSKAPTWFMVVAIVGIIWNLMGALAYIGQAMMTPEAIAMLPEAEQALYQNIPVWVTSAFAFAVWGGLAGCIGLAMKKAWADIALKLSVLGIVVQMYHSFFISNAIDVYGPGGMAMPIMILLFGIYLVYLSNDAKNKKWIS